MIRKRLNIILSLITFFILLSLNVSAYTCYQETANVSTACGGLNTGSYSRDITYFYVNYTKPVNVSAAIWQVKYGNAFINVTFINSNFFDCYNSNETKLSLRIYSHLSPGAGRLSFPQCYNGITWLDVGTRISNGIPGIVPSTNCANEMYDGNWNTSCVYYTGTGASWRSSSYENTTIYADIYEEAIIWNVPSISENSQTYNNLISSGATNNFILNFTYDSSFYSGITASLIYNGTSYSSVINDSDSNYLALSTITAPNVSSEQNISFYWQVTLTDATGNYYFNSSFNNQTVTPLGLSTCGLYTTLILNYTLKDEDTEELLNGSIQSTITLTSLTNSSNYITYSTSNSSTSNLQICLSDNISSSEYLLNAITVYSSTDRVTRFNHIQNMRINGSNIPNNINLFDLNSSESTTFTIQYQNEILLSVPNVVIVTQRKNIGTGVFQTVETSLTDSDGKASAHLIINNGVYNFLALMNNTIIASMDSTGNGFTVKCQALPCLINFFQFNAQAGTVDFTNSENFAYIPSYNESTRVFNLIWNTLDGSNSNVTLNVRLIDPYMNSTICYYSITSSSGIYTCPAVPTNIQDGYILVTIYKDGKFITSGSYDVSIYKAVDIFGKTGTIMAFFIFLIMAAAGIAGGAMGVLILAIIGLILDSVLMLITIGPIFGFTSIFIWLIVLIIIFIIKISRSRSQ